MLNIFKSMIDTATRQDGWDATDSWTGPQGRDGLGFYERRRHEQIRRQRNLLEMQRRGW